MTVERYTLEGLPRRQVLRFMGYRGQELTHEVDARVDEGIARALELAGCSIARHLDGAAACAVMAVTVGMGVERELKRLSATDPVAHVIFDAAATVAVEEAAAACQASIASWAASQGLFANARFSPGYGDLPLAVQPVLLATVDAQRRLGITLTDSLLMVPTKSVTAVMGVFAEAPAARRAERASGSLD